MPSVAAPRWARLWAAVLLPVLCVVVTNFPTGQAADVAPLPRFAGADDKKVMSPVELDKALIAEVKSNSELMKNLEYLSDTIGPRLTGSKGLEKANKWTADKMKEYGLENVKLEPWEIPLGWERGKATMTIVEPDTMRNITLASVGWTPGIKAGKVTGEVVILRGKGKEGMEKYKGKLKNAVVLTSPARAVKSVTDLNYLGAPPPLPKKEDVEPKKEEPKKVDEPKKKESDFFNFSPISFQTPKDEPKKPEPPKEEPLLSLSVSSRDIDEFLRKEDAACKLYDSGKPQNLLMAYGQWRGNDPVPPTDMMPQLVVANDHYAMLWRLASRPAPLVTKVEVEVKNTFIPGPITVFNTVGEVKGSEKPDEFVVVGAHLDSWDLASGTTDNGTGSCVVLETARVVAALAKKGYPPKRTIRFCLFTGEEQGLYGSRKYVERHKDEMPKTSAALVHDTGTGKMIGWALAGRKSSYRILEPELKSLFELDGWRGCDLGFQGGSDHQSFDNRNFPERDRVPGFCGRQEADEYRLTHHTQTDLFDKAKPDNLNQGAQVTCVTVMRIANLPELLPRQRD